MTVHATSDIVLVTNPDAVARRIGEASDVYQPVLQAATVTVTTDASGNATVPFIRQFAAQVFSLTVTRHTSSGTKGSVVVTGVLEDLSGFSVLLTNATGGAEANVSRKLSYNAVGSDGA